MLLVTVTFANNYLNARIAENEFNAMKQFMQTTALQIDDVTWTIGRTQTVRYASSFGQVSFQSAALNYGLYVNDIPVANFTTGVLMFNMPTSKYNIANGYSESILPSSGTSFLQQGTSAPVSHVFVIERVPMNDGSYIRVVVAPSIRMLNSTISTGTTGTATNYYNYYLPILRPSGNDPHLSQSITLEASTVNVTTIQNVNKVRVSLDCPQSSLGFDSSFFNFNSINEVVNVSTGSVLEFYTGNVIVSLGLYS
jgi:hypothetical protein